MRNTNQIAKQIRRTIEEQLKQIRLELHDRMNSEEEQQTIDYINSMNDNELVNKFITNKLDISKKFNVFIGTDINKRTCISIFWQIFWKNVKQDQ